MSALPIRCKRWVRSPLRLETAKQKNKIRFDMKETRHQMEFRNRKQLMCYNTMVENQRKMYHQKLQFVGVDFWKSNFEALLRINLSWCRGWFLQHSLSDNLMGLKLQKHTFPLTHYSDHAILDNWCLYRARKIKVCDSTAAGNYCATCRSTVTFLMSSERDNVVTKKKTFTPLRTH